MGSVGLAVISWLELCSNQVKTFDLILEVSSVSSAGLMHVLPSPHSNTNFVGYRICIRHFKIKDSNNPNLFRIMTWLGIRKKLRAFGAYIPQLTSPCSRARLSQSYVIGEAMINLELGGGYSFHLPFSTTRAM